MLLSITFIGCNSSAGTAGKTTGIAVKQSKVTITPTVLSGGEGNEEIDLTITIDGKKFKGDVDALSDAGYDIQGSSIFEDAYRVYFSIVPADVTLGRIYATNLGEKAEKVSIEIQLRKRTSTGFDVVDKTTVEVTINPIKLM
ncbi:hypothetical protein PVA44_01500 [Entomospira nematocerorum]|uniref:Uncharacterized protein n=1 Tax=Entomospira nematocerorum TaxID=2719987 RepID=A0A968GGB4_9SPIO|nr:hypothetical protein [Entomospira nematocera]NIZ47291.1 hypothetical protein [Entomospira nematocera]WDI34167.1 hypothetical protein PVA44_01500 [Entomospira nematocera]